MPSIRNLQVTFNTYLESYIEVSLMRFATVTAFSCSFGREPDPKKNGIIRWVMPLNHRLRCQCTSIYPGGMNTYTPERGFDPFYTDHPLFTDLDFEIFNYFDCENCSLTNCENGGTFIDDPCHCSCAPKWTGKTCTECALTGCENGGTLDAATCKCTCPKQWMGNDCAECALKTDEDCAHGGSLSDTTSACKCTCTGNWTGNTCTECALTECKNGGTFDATTCICTCPKQWMGIICAETRHYDCQDYLKANSTSMSGVYTIYTSKYPQGLDVYCDMKNWKGSIVIQRRGRGYLNFTRGWDEYMNGFGDMSGSFWLGNEKVRRLTEDQDTSWEIQVQVEVVSMTQQKWRGSKLGNFRLSGENYTIQVDGSWDRGNGCVILSANGKPFSTYDKDNDGDEGINCAEKSQGGWWFDGCDAGEINLNAEFTTNGSKPIGNIECSDPTKANSRIGIKTAL
ncbi:uncharacterized protein [Asterias amurensis]|uniref:uncharacterized protein n=1 Tax=Asterias amurensis TaxID=7602 RepID=UPI003AB8E936